MSRTIFLDTGPLGILTNPKKPTDTVEALRAGQRATCGPETGSSSLRSLITRFGANWYGSAEPPASRHWTPGTLSPRAATFP